MNKEKQTHKINIRLKDETELYDPLDPEQMTLSDDVIGYVMEKGQRKKLGEQLEIHLISDEPVDREHAEKAFDRWCDDTLLNIKKEYRRNHMQQLWMFLIGVLFIAVSLFAQGKVNAVIFTVLSTIGAFSIWEASGFFIIKNPQLRFRRRMVNWLREKGRICFDDARSE